jgi:hypothetical protein
MILPNTDFPLIDFAKQGGVNYADVVRFIESGGADFIMNCWLAYSVGELKKQSLLEDLTPVGGLDLGRRIFEDVFADFLKQSESYDETL